MNKNIPSDILDCVLGVAVRKDLRMRAALFLVRPLLVPLFEAIISRAAERGFVHKSKLPDISLLAERVLYPRPATRPSRTGKRITLKL